MVLAGLGLNPAGVSLFRMHAPQSPLTSAWGLNPARVCHGFALLLTVSQMLFRQPVWGRSDHPLTLNPAQLRHMWCEPNIFQLSYSASFFWQLWKQKYKLDFHCKTMRTHNDTNDPQQTQEVEKSDAHPTLAISCLNCGVGGMGGSPFITRAPLEAIIQRTSAKHKWIKWMPFSKFTRWFQHQLATEPFLRVQSSSRCWTV